MQCQRPIQLKQAHEEGYLSTRGPSMGSLEKGEIFTEEKFNYAQEHMVHLRFWKESMCKHKFRV